MQCNDHSYLIARYLQSANDLPTVHADRTIDQSFSATITDQTCPPHDTTFDNVRKNGVPQPSPVCHTAKKGIPLLALTTRVSNSEQITCDIVSRFLALYTDLSVRLRRLRLSVSNP